MNEHEYKDFIAAVYRITGAVEKRFDSLRDADREAVTLAHDELTRRLEGFPQQYATRVEMEEAARSLQRLEKDSLSATVFSTFVDNYRLEQERNVKDRREVVEVLTSATDRVRAQVAEERGEYVTQEYYDVQHQAVVNQIDAVERWQYKLIGALVFATFVAPLVTGTIVYFFTKEIGR